MSVRCYFAWNILWNINWESKILVLCLRFTNLLYLINRSLHIECRVIWLKLISFKICIINCCLNQILKSFTCHLWHVQPILRLLIYAFILLYYIHRVYKYIQWSSYWVCQTREHQIFEFFFSLTSLNAWHIWDVSPNKDVTFLSFPADLCKIQREFLALLTDSLRNFKSFSNIISYGPL